MIETGKNIPFIVGPTAVGKTETAIHLAKKMQGEIISIDSRQVYKGMTIGTAKPTLKEQSEIPHHLIDILEPEEQISAGGYRELAIEKVEGILSRGHLPIFVGGSGMYVSAMTKGIFESSATDSAIRNKIQKDLEEQGAAALYNHLVDVDPEAAVKIHLNNVKRITRALEIYESTGKPPSQHFQEQEDDPAFPYKIFVLFRERSKLYERINQRVDLMIEQGLIDEVKTLVESGKRSSLDMLKTLGYQEVLPYLEGQCSLDEMVEKVKQNTRRYAKRQLTWFRHQAKGEWIDVDQYESPEAVAEFISEHLA